jgi:hypothetical protein
MLGGYYTYNTKRIEMHESCAPRNRRLEAAPWPRGDGGEGLLEEVQAGPRIAWPRWPSRIDVHIGCDSGVCGSIVPPWQRCASGCSRQPSSRPR